MESPVQMFSAQQGDPLFATPNFDQRDDGVNDDFGYFDGLNSGCDTFMTDLRDQQAWSHSLMPEVLDPLLGGAPAFGKHDSAFCSTDQMFAAPELSPPNSASDDIDGEELFREQPPLMKQQHLPQLDTQILDGAHARRYGQITPPASSKSPEAGDSSLQATSGANSAGRRGRKPSAKARKEEETASPAKQSKGSARKSRKPAAVKEVVQPEEFEEEPEDDQTDESKAKRARFLERNRQAAFTCRQRKKQWAKDLEEKHRNMERDNRDLKAARDSLQEEYRFLRRQLISHSTCECTGAREYIQRSSKVLEALGGDNGPDWVAALSSSSNSGSASASPPAGPGVSMGTPTMEKALRASLSQMVADDSSTVDPALKDGKIQEPTGLELDGMTF